MLEALGYNMKVQSLSGYYHKNVEGTKPNAALSASSMLTFGKVHHGLSLLFGTQAKLQSTSSSSIYWNLSYHFIPTMKNLTQANNNYSLFCQSPKYPPTTFQLIGNAAIKITLTITFLDLNSELVHFLPCISK